MKLEENKWIWSEVADKIKEKITFSDESFHPVILYRTIRLLKKNLYPRTPKDLGESEILEALLLVEQDFRDKIEKNKKLIVSRTGYAILDEMISSGWISLKNIQFIKGNTIPGITLAH